MPTLKAIRWAASGAILILAIVWLAGRLPSGAGIGGPFTLTGTSGARVSDSDFRGKWMLVYFGYAYCPDICPTELQTISSAFDLLGPRAKSVAPIFITLDPARDSPAALGQYVRLFDDRLIGLTGSASEIASVARAYSVNYAIITGPNRDSYVIDHSSLVYLLGPDGTFRMILPQGGSPEELADSVRSEMTKG